MKGKTTKENVTEKHGEAGVSTRHLAAIDALVGGASVAEAARQSGYTREVLSRLKHHNPIFRATLNQRRAEARDEVTANLRGLINEITTSIRTALQSPELSPSATLQAGLAALPKLYALIAENETGLIYADKMAAGMVTDAMSNLFNGMIGATDEDIQKLLRKSEAEL